MKKIGKIVLKVLIFSSLIFIICLLMKQKMEQKKIYERKMEDTGKAIVGIIASDFQDIDPEMSAVMMWMRENEVEKKRKVKRSDTGFEVYENGEVLKGLPKEEEKALKKLFQETDIQEIRNGLFGVEFMLGKNGIYEWGITYFAPGDWEDRRVIRWEFKREKYVCLQGIEDANLFAIYVYKIDKEYPDPPKHPLRNEGW